MPKASNSLFHHNPTIYRDGLTATERQQIEQRYAPYCRFQEFWIGFVDYQQGRDCPRGWSDSVAGQSWDRGAEMRILRKRAA
jgi:hypothetical protein